MYSNTFCIHCLFTSSIASTIDLKKEVLLGRFKNVPVGTYERVKVMKLLLASERDTLRSVQYRIAIQ